MHNLKSEKETPFMLSVQFTAGQRTVQAYPVRGAPISSLLPPANEGQKNP
jgi:hypothetical protein